MNWLLEAFSEQTVIQAIVVISLVAAVGVSLGKIRLFGVSLGITFVFFTGIIAGHLGIVINSDMLAFAQNLGLILFVYTLGLQVGPSFFSSFKKGGIELNIMSIGVILLGLVLVMVFHWTSGVSLPVMMGLLSGAVTNTPALGAAQQAFLQIDPGNTREITDMALACAITYPLGVIGVILAIAVMRKATKKRGQ
jgi:AspT/YidE/YbjL antiporter-like protein